MSRTPRKTFFRNLLERRLFLAVNVAIFCLLLLSFGKEFARNYQIQREIHALQTQAEALSARHLEIQQLTQAIQTESFIEREARLKLGLSKPGEQVVVIGETGGRSGTATGAESLEAVETLLATPSLEQNDPRSVANFRKWWYYFFDKPTYHALKSYGLSSESRTANPNP